MSHEPVDSRGRDLLVFPEVARTPHPEGDARDHQQPRHQATGKVLAIQEVHRASVAPNAVDERRDQE
jgi:hypothetical protein